MNKTNFLLIGALLVAACSQPPASGDAAKQNNKTGNQDTLTYLYKNFRKESTHIARTGTSADTTYVALTYPEFKPEEVNNFVKKTLLISDNPDVQAKTVDEFASSFISNYDQFASSQKSYSFPWMKEIKLRVISQWPGMITFEKNANEFAGGAHGNYGTYYYNYNTVSDSSMSLNELFTPESKQKLDTIAEQIFRKNEKLSATASLENGYFFTDSKFSLNENFLIREDGLLFFYNPYEIKPYAAGTTELFIPYPAINDLLRKDAPIPKKSIQ